MKLKLAATYYPPDSAEHYAKWLEDGKEVFTEMFQMTDQEVKGYIECVENIDDDEKGQNFFRESDRLLEPMHVSRGRPPFPSMGAVIMNVEGKYIGWLVH